LIARKLGKYPQVIAAASHILKAFVKFAQYCILQNYRLGVSYDGRRAEPNNLPVNFHCLLQEKELQGLSTKVLPHNFNELIDASIKY
jgi:hypothetical protein